jgi:hypothetical protein
VVHRTAPVGLRVTAAQRRRCFGLLASAGDVRACTLDLTRSSGTSRPGSFLQVQTDGNVVVYDSAKKALWSRTGGLVRQDKPRWVN